jgi:hypothetical protein
MGTANQRNCGALAAPGGLQLLAQPRRRQIGKLGPGIELVSLNLSFAARENDQLVRRDAGLLPEVRKNFLGLGELRPNRLDGVVVGYRVRHGFTPGPLPTVDITEALPPLGSGRHYRQ